MGTSLSSILKKKKVLENNDDTYESESNSTVSGIPSFEESQKTRKSDLRSLLQAKKDKEKLVELQNEQKRQERQDWLRKSSTSQHTTAMTDFIRSDREKVAESSIPMADAVKQYNQIKQQKWMLNEAQYENDLLQEYRKRKRIEKEQQEAKDKVGFQDGDTFIQYTDIPQQKDFADTVKKAKENAAKANDQYAFMYNNKKLPFGDKGLTIGGKKLTLGGKESNPVESYVNTFGDGKNVFGKSSVLDITSGQDNAKSPLRRYALLNDSERDIYDYLFERQGKDTAEKYLDSIQGELNQRGAEANYEHNNQYKGPIKTIVNTTQSIGAGMQNAVEGIKSIPDFAMGTRKNAMPTESELSQTKMLENAGTIDGFTYKMANAIGNMIPSIIVGGAGGPAVSSAIFAAQTGGQSYRQDIMDGRPVEGAQVNAVLTAADETVTNLLLGGISQYGGGFIKKTLGNTKVAQAAKQGITSALAKNPAVRRAVLGVINYGSDMLSEGTQEAVQDLTESIRKHFIYGDELDLTGDLTDPQTWEDFLLGAATAGIMNAPATIANNVAINNYGKNLDVDYRDYSEGIDTDQTHYTNPADAKEAQGLQRMAEEYAAMQRQGKFVNNRDKAEYDMRLWEWQNRMAEEQKGQDEQTLQAQGQPTQPQEQAIQSQKQASQNQEYTNRSQQENQAEPTAQETIQNSDVKRPTEQSVQPEYESTPLERQDNQIQEEHQTDSPEKPYAAPKATQEQPQATAAHNSEQDTINAQENEHRNPQSNFEAEDNVKLSDQESTEYKSHYGKYGGDALLNTYDGSVDVSTFNKAFGRAYDAGYNQIDLDTATHSALMSLLSDQQIEAAYRAGIQDYNLDNQVKPKYTQGQIKEGGLGTVSDYATQDQRNVAEHIGKKTGLKINLVDNLSQENATASYKPGEITININSEDFNGSLSHELTHFIKDTAPESYRLYQEIVTEAQMKATGKAWEDLVESYTNRYKDAGQDLTRQQVMEEIAADATQKFLNDPDFIDQVVKKDRNLAQKIIDFLSDVIDSIKNLIKTGSTRAAAKNLEQDVQMYEDARYAWLLGLEQGSKDYKAGKERADNIMQSSKYELNQFGFEEYGEKEKGWWKNNDSIIICNTKQDIADFYRDHVHKKPYARLYIGKIGPELAQRIYKDTGVNTENLNVAITSEFEDSHSNPEKERSRGQTPVTPEILSRLPEIISSYDKVENTTSSKDRKPVLKFEKDINGKNVAVEYVRSKKGMLELHTMYAWENKNSRSVSTTLTMPEKTDPYRTSETYSVITPATKDNIQPGTEKSKTRFQLDDVDDTMSERRIQALQDQNEALKQANDLLEQQFKLTDKDAVRTEDIKKVARNILKEYGSKYSSEILERNLSKLYQYIRGAGQVDGQAITEAATSMGKSILEKSVQKDTELTEHYKDLRKQIKDTKIAITDQDKADLASVGGYNEFRKRYFGKMKMGADGISIDSLYQELQGQYPELFPADVTHPADELVAIASALDQTAPQIKNPYAANMDEMAYMVGQDILSSYFDVRKPSATFADKKEAQMQKLRWQYQQKIRDYKNDLKSKYDESLKQIKKQNLEESARLAEQYKNLTEAERKEQREYYKKRMDDLRNSKNQELAAMQQRSKERIKSLRENQQKREDKRQIIKERKKLQNWLLKPTDSKHIPEGLRQSVAAFLNNIDFSPNDEDSEIKTQRKEDWKAAQDAFKEILDNGGVYVDQKTGDTMTMDIDPDIAQRIQELIEKTKGIDKLDNLDAYSMGELKKTVMAMKKAITEVNDLKSNKKSGELSILADGVFRDLEQRRNKVEYVGPAGMGDKLLNYDMLDPQTMFGKMGDNMKSTYDALRNGLDKKTEKLRSAQEYVDDIVDKYGIKPKELREWTGSNAKTQHFKTSRGEIDLTVAQVMSLYELNKRSQARGHMYDRNGGIKQAPVVGKAKLEGTTYTPAQIKKNYRPVKVTAADVETITKTLTPAQRALADGLQQFMGDQCAAWGNEVTMDMYGYEKFTAKNYFPISTDKNYVATRQGDAGNKASTIKNMGITKSTTPYANNPLIIEDIFDVFSRQVDNMSTYNAYVIPLSDLNKVYNYKDTRGMTEFGSSIKEEIERTFGKQGNDYIVKLVSDINGTVNKDKSIASQLVSNMKAASVAGNLRVAAQQPTAYIRASMEINPKYLARGATTITRKGQWDLICKYAPIAQWKDWGFYRMDTSRQMKDIMFNTDSTKQRFVNATMILAEKGDQLAWNRLWRACEYECMDQHPDLKEGTEEFYERVGKRFSEVVDKTQVVDSILHRTQIMRSQSEINQLATSFMAEPLKTYDMLYRAATDVKTKKEGSKSRAVRAATVFVLTGVATSIAASAVDMLRDDDRDKNSKEKYIDSLKSNIFDNLNLLNNIPWVKEIPSIIAGYTPTRADLSGFEDMIYAWNQIKKLKDGTSKYTPQYVAVYTAQMASKLTGIPIKSLTRDMGAVIDSIFDSAGGKADYTWLKQKYDMGSKENLEMYTKMMIQAHRNGDQDFQKKIKDDLNKAGIDNDTITNKIKTVIKSELIGKDSVNPLVEAAAQAKQSYDLEAYEDAVSQLTSQGYATKIVKSAIDARIKQLEGKEEIDWEAEVQTEPDSLYGDILTDQGASEDSSSVKFYSNSDLLAAIGQYDNKNAKSLDPFKKMADAIVKSKVDEGKTQKEAAGSIKTSITSHYKPLWIAADRKGREEIQNVLKQLKVNGKALYTGEDWTNWNKAAKKKQKKQ
ncbi:hypothetical protein DW251_11810 [Clostridium sp. AM22-11AC]|nr:hypothetical protein DW251_11810 [Clostridium sp. AM22-11AC]DAX13951.1 MAG TPA: Dot/Icm substrate protein [Caudoviricetes sp.]